MDTTIRGKLADKIKQLRKSRKLTQEKLAELTRIDYKYVQRIEGKNPPALKVDTLERLAKALKVKPSELLNF
jgi:transcriptional regulator with XRE-family HTH domain